MQSRTKIFNWERKTIPVYPYHWYKRFRAMKKYTTNLGEIPYVKNIFLGQWFGSNSIYKSRFDHCWRLKNKIFNHPMSGHNPYYHIVSWGSLNGDVKTPPSLSLHKKLLILLEVSVKCEMKFLRKSVVTHDQRKVQFVTMWSWQLIILW